MNILDLNSGVFTRGRLAARGVSHRHIGAAVNAGFLEEHTPGAFRVNPKRKMALIEALRDELQPGQNVRIARHGKVVDYQVVKDENGRVKLIDPNDPNGKIETRMRDEIDTDQDGEEEEDDKPLATEENIFDVIYRIYVSLHDATGATAESLYRKLNRILDANNLTMKDVLAHKKAQNVQPKRGVKFYSSGIDESVRPSELPDDVQRHYERLRRKATNGIDGEDALIMYFPQKGETGFLRIVRESDYEDAVANGAVIVTESHYLGGAE